MALQGRLTVVQGSLPNTEYPLPLEGDFTIGRDRHMNLPIMVRTVSRKHAKITFRNGAYTIADLESKSGVLVNDRKVSVRNAAQQQRHARDVAIVFARLVGAAHDRFIDSSEIALGILGAQRGERVGGDHPRANRRERSGVAPDGSAHALAGVGGWHLIQCTLLAMQRRAS